MGTSEDLARAAERAGVREPRVLDAVRKVRRELFLPEEWRHLAYEDAPVPIRGGQVTTQPSLVARMVAALDLRGGERVLEVGTGTGYQAAILARLAAEVFTIERLPELAEEARRNLRTAGAGRVVVVVGDGSLGLPAHAPYDRIVVAAAAPRVPPPLVEQLAEGGRLVQPLGPGGAEVVVAFRKEGGRLVEDRWVVPAAFVPLIGLHGAGREPPAGRNGPSRAGPPRRGEGRRSR